MPTACVGPEPEGSGAEASASAKEWEVDFFDDSDRFDPENWQDQILWANDEDQCYVRDNLHDTRAVSNGTLKLRVVDLGEFRECDNFNKFGDQRPPTHYLAGRITSKNRQEFVRGGPQDFASQTAVRTGFFRRDGAWSTQQGAPRGRGGRGRLLAHDGFARDRHIRGPQ